MHQITKGQLAAGLDCGAIDGDDRAGRFQINPANVRTGNDDRLKVDAFCGAAGLVLPFGCADWSCANAVPAAATAMIVPSESARRTAEESFLIPSSMKLLSI